MPTSPTDIVDPGYTVNAITPIILSLDPTKGENGAPGAPGQSINWRGVWATGVQYAAYDAVSRNPPGASYLAVVANISVDPATDNGSVWGVLSAPGATGPQGPAGTTYRGAWVSTTTYVKNDLVTKLGTTYIAVSASTNIDPVTDGGTHWQVFAAGGTGDMSKAVYDVNNDGIVDHAAAVPWVGITGTPASFTPAAHESTHELGGSDPLPAASTTKSGLLKPLTGLTTDYVGGDNACHDIVSAVQPVIWSVRLRSFNAVGNPTFEVDQRNVGTALANPGSGTLTQDRWAYNHVGTSACSIVQQPLNIVIPGTNFLITRSVCRVTLTTAQASLGAGDYIFISQSVEGPQWRELATDVHSVSLLVQSSVAGLKFGMCVRDGISTTKSLVKLCTIPSANTPILITLPNLPVWPSGNFTYAPGVFGYFLNICLAAGSTFIAPANDTWQNGTFIGAAGQSNFAASPVNSTFDIAFIQHEPGALCTTPIDCPFGQNLDGDFGCLRYFSKSYDYATKPGSVSNSGYYFAAPGASTFPKANARWPKIMAKTPTVSIYATATGAVNTATDDSTGGAIAATANDINSAGMGSLSIPGGLTAGHAALFHYTADTLW
jgi:hypothetical protein